MDNGNVADCVIGKRDQQATQKTTKDIGALEPLQNAVFKYLIDGLTFSVCTDRFRSRRMGPGLDAVFTRFFPWVTSEF